MSATVADHLLERLATGGALDRAGGGIDGPGPLEFVQVRHEEMAAFTACPHAKFTGDVGVCLATSGPDGDLPDRSQRPPR